MPVSLETIDYQIKDRFPDQLERIVEEIYHALNKEQYKSGKASIDHHSAMHEMEKLIFDRFGLTVLYKGELKSFSPAAIIPFFKDYERTNGYVQGVIDSMHMAADIRAVESIRKIIKERRDSAKRIHNKTGYVNTKLARVGGYMSEVRHYLIVDFAYLKNHVDISPREMVAIIMHEIGHAFDGLEEHYRVQTTNRAIFDVLADLNSAKPDKVLYKYKHAFSGQEYKDSQLSTSKDRQDFCADLAMKYVGGVESQLQSAKYDETNFENMADSFATRFGLGKELASGLRKLYAYSGALMRNNTSMRTLAVSLEVLVMATLFLLVPIYGFIIYTVVMSYLLRISAGTMTYDEIMDRVTRIRNTIVHSLLKDPNMPKDVVVDALEQIDYIESMAKESMVYKSLLADLGDVMYSDARRDKYYIDLQQNIEAQLNNRLFIQSAKLRTSS